MRKRRAAKGANSPARWITKGGGYGSSQGYFLVWQRSKGASSLGRCAFDARLRIIWEGQPSTFHSDELLGMSKVMLVRNYFMFQCVLFLQTGCETPSWRWGQCMEGQGDWLRMKKGKLNCS
mmetsp:Transcript_26770/g.56917  ORF Transcript_26770/g.56917 Transcript_26770/m.56917 type:complete len:121 (+) Transcript_26770:1365-1727(+)